MEERIVVGSVGIEVFPVPSAEIHGSEKAVVRIGIVRSGRLA